MGGMNLPEPYYHDPVAGITIYNCDCKEILGLLPKVDLLLTDPPYGIGRSGQCETFTKDAKHKRKEYEDSGWDGARPCVEIFDAMMNVSRSQVIWGGNYFADFLPPKMGWLYWDKGQKLSMSDGELAWTNRDAALRSITCNRGEICQDGAVHPTQKPIKVMTWCFSFFPDAETILDPFMGSGTTLVAAKLLGKKCIGIEIDETYCRIAVERLAQGNLFTESK